mgnify:CR=1 FL=1
MCGMRAAKRDIIKIAASYCAKQKQPASAPPKSASLGDSSAEGSSQNRVKTSTISVEGDKNSTKSNAAELDGDKNNAEGDKNNPITKRDTLPSCCSGQFCTIGTFGVILGKVQHHCAPELKGCGGPMRGALCSSGKEYPGGKLLACKLCWEAKHELAAERERANSGAKKNATKPRWLWQWRKHYRFYCRVAPPCSECLQARPQLPELSPR